LEQLFSKPHLDASVSAKKLLFCEVTKLENFDKNYLLSKKNQKFPFEHFRFSRSKSPMKGLSFKVFKIRLINESFRSIKKYLIEKLSNKLSDVVLKKVLVNCIRTAIIRHK
jgi:hypothetical protein